MNTLETFETLVPEHGQISIPEEIRAHLNWEPGKRLAWEVTDDGACLVSAPAKTERRGAFAMRGFAKTFRETKDTAYWMKIIRDGEMI